MNIIRRATDSELQRKMENQNLSMIALQNDITKTKEIINVTN